MMTMTNAITPPPELVREWCAHNSEHENYEQFWHYIATQAAQWGADQELEACCALLLQEGAWPWPEEVARLRAARRPKPPSLKEQALHELVDAYDKDKIDDTTYDTIRAALLALPND
jgi:hypothetical protein